MTNPLQALGQGTFALLRCEVVGVDLIPNTKMPRMTFSVRPVDAGYMSGDEGGVISNVVMLQPGFGNLNQSGDAPTGLLYVPEVGSRVLCVNDGYRWCILGCYTGPVTTKTETATDPNKALISYNPGIEQVVPRSVGPRVYDALPHWAFSLTAGDVIMGKGASRIKVCNGGAVIGGDENCFALYKRDGQLLDRCAERETHMLGFWQVHTYGTGVDDRMLEVTGPVKNLPGSYVYNCTILETNLYAAQMTPFLVRQRGHIDSAMLSQGRSAAESKTTPTRVTMERAANSWFALRDALIQPLSPVLPTQVTAEEGEQVTLFDQRVKGDGSFDIFSGGTVPGTASPKSDFHLSYDVRTSTFILRVGTGGVDGAVVKVQGKTPADTKVDVQAGSASVKVLADVTVQAGTSIAGRAPTVDIQALLTAKLACGPSVLTMTPAATTLVSPMINLTGMVAITGPLAVGGPIISTPAPGAPPVNLTTHTHTYAPGPGTPVQTSPGVG